MAKLKTNEDLVLNLMNYSPFGAMGQMFVVEAIRKYADALVREPLPASEPGAMFSNEAWNGVAADVKQRCDAFYGEGSGL